MKNGQSHRDEVIVPDSAHGTNPASASFAGFKSVTVKSNQRGEVDIEDLKRVVNDNTAAIMLTNPNTLGIFEQDIIEIGKIVHEAGGLLYYDGANLNAILDKVRPMIWALMRYILICTNIHWSSWRWWTRIRTS